MEVDPARRLPVTQTGGGTGVCDPWNGRLKTSLSRNSSPVWPGYCSVAQECQNWTAQFTNGLKFSSAIKSGMLVTALLADPEAIRLDCIRPSLSAINLIVRTTALQA